MLLGTTVSKVSDELTRASLGRIFGGKKGILVFACNFALSLH